MQQTESAPRPLPRRSARHMLGDTQRFRRSPLDFAADVTRGGSDIVRCHVLALPLVVINHPDHVKRVLQERHRNYDKDVFLFNLVRPFIGDSILLEADWQRWRRHRRMMQPAFHHRQVERFCSLMVDETEAMLGRWDARPAGEPFDVAEEMTALALQIVARALFSIEVGRDADVLVSAWMELNAGLAKYLRLPLLPLRVPTPAHRRFWRALRTLDEIAYRMIGERRAGADGHDDVLSMLLAARDDDGVALTDSELRDELVTLLLAGHETAALSLAWTWYLLARNPDAEAQLHEEVDRVLGGRRPIAADLPQLPYLRRVIDESLRLYPPGWQVMRHARDEDVIAGHRVPAGATVFWSIPSIHRHPEFWERADRFEPSRFEPDQVAARHRYAYVPFSMGPRTCIGNTFALTEMQLVVATIAQRYRLELVDDRPIEPEPLITLGPKGGVPVRRRPR